MLIQCRWCTVSRNCQLDLGIHERVIHPKEYWLAKAENLEKSAERSLQEALKLREKFNL